MTIAARHMLVFLSLAGAFVFPSVAAAQRGFPDRLRHYSDTGRIPFRIGTAVRLRGGPTRNGYEPGLTTGSPRDRAIQEIVRDQFNQIEPGNELKMMSVWTGGARRVNGHFVAVTNLNDPSGPLTQLCAWAEAQRHKLMVRGHCMVYNQLYTLPRFPAGQQPLFQFQGFRSATLNPAYTPQDLMEMLESYVRQVVDASMVQNAASRKRFHYRVVAAWDVTNEVLAEGSGDMALPQLGFAYRIDDPWYRSGPLNTAGVPGYDYVKDIYRWAAEEMRADVGKTIAGQQITAADRFTLYYNDFNLEWSASKMEHALNLVRHVRSHGGDVDGLGFQAHLQATHFPEASFEKNIRAAIADNLRFSLTEVDCALQTSSSPGGQRAAIAAQEQNQGRSFGAAASLCVRYGEHCDCFQIWGATDDGSWIPNGEATPITRWVTDTRPGPTKGKEGYWPKEGQFDPLTLLNLRTGEPDRYSGHPTSDAYDEIVAALKRKHASRASTATKLQKR